MMGENFKTATCDKHGFLRVYYDGGREFERLIFKGPMPHLTMKQRTWLRDAINEKIAREKETHE